MITKSGGPPRAKNTSHLGYFETNAPRMRYKHSRSLGLFIGSGAAEGRLQGGHRAAPQTFRHALVLRRRHRHPHPALPASQRPLGRNLAAAAQPVRSSLTGI